MLNWLQHFGQFWFEMISSFGRAHIFLCRLLPNMLSQLFRFSLVSRQLYASGVLTLSIILVSGLFVGMVLALQGYNTLAEFGADESLGIVVALTLVRELGPVILSLIHI